MPDLGWAAGLLGALTTAHFASTVFSGRGRDFRGLALASGLVVVSRLLGADWVVHPAAGLLLAFLFSRLGGVRRGHMHLPLLGVALLSAAAFMWLGAGWLKFPLVVVLALTVFSALGRRGQVRGKTVTERPERPAQLPQGTTGTPVQPVQVPEGVPVPTPPARPPEATQYAASSGPNTGLNALHQDQRLPAQARALLVAIDLRTIEAQKALAAQGQTSTQAAYEARAIREEYAPAAVQAYLKLPPTRADTLPIEGHRTGRDLLCEQLELLLSAAQKLVEFSTHAGGQELLTNGRFLREKFGQVSPDEQDLKLK
ncbi:hypothetical protein D3875_18440 [Deinococcus cavernae]|uniref:Uncharacterized protein n=1 Tax=Deinococcus cavernae TaxID=2320857 RepID=A0A418VCL7_9DEIO|nr:hypothetical protein [Deinococcus cavernae]RJF73865.1 hypothetical protein D3875_18440 [Deinococcus cavernae]